MEERELLEAYESEKDALKAWGGFVLTSICEELGRMLPSDFKLDDLLKVPPCCRVKSDASLVAKAFFRRRKVYTNPLQEITDKIGVRFVVLLESETSLVEKALRNVNAWTFEKDRDYEQERSERPEIFTYQSVHYVVYSNSRMSQDGVEIPYRFPCEVQIRTLLQHAYSEFSHRYYYKNTTQSGDLGRRLLARSCALIEVTDGFFSQASESIRAFADKAERLLQEASRLYT
jgi:ppGpp synthetase/RelA/SpoT-type nucleotidyltranferase